MWSRDTAARKVIFASFSRYVVLPGGRRINVPADFEARRRRVRWLSGGARRITKQSQAKSAADTWREKNSPRGDGTG